MTDSKTGLRLARQLAWLPLVLLAIAPVRTADGIGEWRSWAANIASTRYAPLDQINRATVKNLQIAWRQSAIPDAVKQVMPNLRPAPTNYQNTPLMIGGLVYMSTGIGIVAALDAATGKVVWFDTPPPPETPTAASRGVAYWSDGRDGRILAVVGSSLVALNARTGQRYPSFGSSGAVDLRQGLSRAFDNYSWRSAPIVVRDVVIVGSVVGDINSAARPATMEAPPGDVRGYDVRTGKQLWTFHTIPRPGEVGNETWEQDSWAYTGHTNVWGTMSGDEELGHVYLPLTTPTNDWYGGHRPGANLFAESIVALDARTGQAAVALPGRPSRHVGLRFPVSRRSWPTSR